VLLVELHTSLHGPPAADGTYSQNPKNSLLIFKHLLRHSTTVLFKLRKNRYQVLVARKLQLVLR